jgi:DNA-directed RNA polymerase subunit E'/Rpb7
MKRTPLANRRVIFKLHDMEPLDATVLKQDETGYWIRGGSLAGLLDQSNCSQPESDVRYLEFSRIEWLRTLRQRS